MGGGLIVFTLLSGATGVERAALLLAGLALVGFGLFCVSLELGRPLRALRVFRNPRTSWMAREAWTSVAARSRGARCRGRRRGRLVARARVRAPVRLLPGATAAGRERHSRLARAGHRAADRVHRPDRGRGLVLRRRALARRCDAVVARRLRRAAARPHRRLARVSAPPRGQGGTRRHCGARPRRPRAADRGNARCRSRSSRRRGIHRRATRCWRSPESPACSPRFRGPFSSSCSSRARASTRASRCRTCRCAASGCNASP